MSMTASTIEPPTSCGHASSGSGIVGDGVDPQQSVNPTAAAKACTGRPEAAAPRLLRCVAKPSERLAFHWATRRGLSPGKPSVLSLASTHGRRVAAWRGCWARAGAA
eukprot:16436196-Heterocapsa_arctica.AAC.1